MNRGFKHSAETIARLKTQTAGEGNGFFGKRHSEETKAKMRASRVGNKNSFFGKSHTEDARAKISANRKGKCLGEDNPLHGRWQDPEFREKISRTRVEKGVAVGEKNPNYRHGNTCCGKVRRDTTTEYRQWRVAVFKRDNYTCQFCGNRGGDLEADHIKPFSFFPELRVDINNGRTLCLPCHRTTFKAVSEYRKAHYAAMGVENRSTDGN